MKSVDVRLMRVNGRRVMRDAYDVTWFVSCVHDSGRQPEQSG